MPGNDREMLMDLKGKFQHNSVQTGSLMNENLFNADQMIQQDELENLMNLPLYEQEQEQEETGNVGMSEDRMLDANLDLIAAGMTILNTFKPHELIAEDHGSMNSAVGDPVLSPKTRAKRFAQYSNWFGQGKNTTRREKLQTIQNAIKGEEEESRKK